MLVFGSLGVSEFIGVFRSWVLWPNIVGDDGNNIDVLFAEDVKLEILNDYL